MRTPPLPRTAAALLVAGTAAFCAVAAPAAAAPYVPGEVIVKYKDDAVTGGAVGPAPVRAPGGGGQRLVGQGHA